LKIFFFLSFESEILGEGEAAEQSTNRRRQMDA
jgi:hypothetical protein